MTYTAERTVLEAEVEKVFGSYVRKKQLLQASSVEPSGALAITYGVQFLRNADQRLFLDALNTIPNLYNVTLLSSNRELEQ